MIFPFILEEIHCFGDFSLCQWHIAIHPIILQKETLWILWQDFQNLSNYTVRIKSLVKIITKNAMNFQCNYKYKYLIIGWITEWMCQFHFWDIRCVAKKVNMKKYAFIKKPQFFPTLFENLSKWGTNEDLILTKSRNKFRGKVF